jgi:hypothetical protein
MAHTQSSEDEAPEWGPLLRGERRAGRLLVRIVAASAGTTLLGAVVAVPLSLAHLWRPVVALPVLLVVLAVAIRASRCVISRPMPPWSLALCLLVAVGAGVWAGATHDEHVVLRRDAGSYALYGQQLADKHQLPIDVQVRRLGGAKVVDDPDVAVASPGFFEQGHGARLTVVPQFLIGFPAWLSVGMWVGGWTGLFLVPAVFAALAILSVGALTAATIGPRWAPLVALATAVTAPVLHAGRSTYSEPAALLALTAALTLLALSVENGSRRPERSAQMGLLAGLLLGGAGLIRLDALREVVLLIPFAVLLAVRRHVAARPVMVGVAVGTGVSAVVALGLARPYLSLVKGSLLPLLALGALAGGCGLVVVRWARRRERLAEHAEQPEQPEQAERAEQAEQADLADPAQPADRADPAQPADRADGTDESRPPPRRSTGRQTWQTWLPWLFAGLVLLVGLALVTRPWWLIVHQSPTDPSASGVASLQAAQGLPIDRTRNYTEQSVTWVVWWVGPAAALLAWAGAVLAAYRCGIVVARGKAIAAWFGPFVIGSGSIVLTLVRPGITPDHPWADRRLVVAVLPGVLLLGAGAVAQLVRLARRRAPLPVLAAAALVGAVALVWPAYLATEPIADQRTELGELAAVQTVCRSFHQGDVAVAVGERTTNEWVQVLRGICDVPTLGVHVRGTSTTTDAGRAAVARALGRVVPKVEAAGGRVVLVSDRKDLLVALGRPAATELVQLHTLEDQRLLTERPSGSAQLVIDLWAAPATPAAG